MRTLKKTAHNFTFKKSTTKGFTLIELLVVIAIIGILAIVTFLVIDPIELSRKSRDTVRISDLQTLNNVITVAVQSASDSAATVLCYNTTAACSGSSNNTSDPNNRKIDGTGWVKVNLTGQAANLPVLPVDPINKAGKDASGNNADYWYNYGTNAAGDAWEIDGALESKQYTVTQTKMTQDGGNNNNRYEIGSDMTILP